MCARRNFWAVHLSAEVCHEVVADFVIEHVEFRFDAGGADARVDPFHCLELGDFSAGGPGLQVNLVGIVCINT